MSNRKGNSVIDIATLADAIHELAVDNPDFSAAYALMCKKLGMMHDSDPDSNVTLREAIINRCQLEFEKEMVDENGKALEVREFEDPEKKKKLKAALVKEEWRTRVKFAGNIRFIGELFKQGMLTARIMHRCIQHLLTGHDEEDLEYLCKLLSTIGRDLESKNQNLDRYFSRIIDIFKGKSTRRVSLRVRAMLHDVIELRMNKWIPKSDDQASDRKYDRMLLLYNMSMPPSQPVESIPPPKPASTPNKPASTMSEERIAKKSANILEQANVGDRVKEPQFIRILATAILEVAIEPYNNTWKFRVDKFQNLQNLISRYIDANELLELQCLFAIREYIHKLEHPSGVLLQIIEKLWEDSIISNDAYFAWESNKDSTAQTGKSVARMALQSFFTSLKEANDDASSTEEA